MNILNNPNLASKLLRHHELTVAVYGLGNVGSAVAAVWLRAGAKVIGVDISPQVVTNASKGKTHTNEGGVSEAFSRGIRSKRFSATTDGVLASKQSIFKIATVPVLLANGSADLSALEDVTRKIAEGLKAGDVVSVNCTIPPGTTEEFVLPLLEKVSGLKVEDDFGLFYNPERIYEGRAIKDIEENYPTVIGGAGRRSLMAGTALYSKISKKGVITMSSMRAAEMEKVAEGLYRDVNIALANELARICEKLSIDYWEIIKAANSQPYSHLHKPGTGVGGACIPVYPHFIIDAAAKVKASADIITLARSTNSLMPKYCVEQALSLLGRTGKQPANSKIAVLGLAFRGGVSDTRLSSSYDIVKELLNAGCRVTVHDPYVTSDTNLPGSVLLTKKLDEALGGSDLVIIATDHPQYAKITPRRFGSAAVYDGRGIFDGSKLGSLFAGIGRAKD